jgi:hypothetical protein
MYRNEKLLADPERFRQISERIPAARWGEPKDFAGPAVFLASQASQYVCGELLVVDGVRIGFLFPDRRRIVDMFLIVLPGLDGTLKGHRKDPRAPFHRHTHDKRAFPAIGVDGVGLALPHATSCGPFFLFYVLNKFIVARMGVHNEK